MNTRIRVAVLGTLSVIAGTLLAEEPTKLSQTQPKIERVVPAGSLIGSELNSKEHHLGTVSDYVIDLTTGHIALILVTNNDTPVDAPERTALPSAKVSFDGKAWQLTPDVSDLQVELQGMETFSRDKWSTEVSRGWVEYVHVRYGNSALSGVQTKFKAEATDTSP